MTAPAMPALLLRRIKQNDYATYGRLDSFVTLEPPNPMPAGTYTAVRYFSPGHQCVVFCLQDVPGHSYIEIHVGCLPRDTKDCVLIGTRFGDVDYGDGRADGKGPGILGSRTAFAVFMAAHPEQQFTLTITDVPQ